VAVFAAAIPAKFYRLPGEGVKELVLLKADVLLQDLVRPLKGKRFGGVKLAGVRLVRQTEAEGEEAGVWITASIDFVGPLREAGQLIEGLFEIQKAALDVKGFVGSVPDWKAPLEPGRFGLKGVMAGEYKEGRKIAFTKVAVELKVEREEEGGYSTAVEFSGDVIMTLPGGVVKMGWTIMEETPGTWTLRVEDKEIGDVVGFKGLNVSTVSVGTEDGADMM